MNPLATLQQYWGHTAFRPLQQEIIQAVLAGEDVLALLPTGGGKSICFQVPALMREGLCVVVSPLIALMKDQVDQLKKRGIAAAVVHSGMRPQAIDLVLDNCIYGPIKFLYVSPERLQTDLLQERIKKMDVNLLAIDEAHCISQWGYDFRPAYLEIAAFRALLPAVNAIALTATATPEVQQDIQEKLQLQAPLLFQKSFARDNLAYVVRKTEDKDSQLLKILRNVPGTAIVYVNTRRKTQKVAQMLAKNGINAAFYHAGLTAQERASKQEDWIQAQIRVIVATNAFGMGIDKPDVRVVIHLDLPTTLEAYYQEAGRAGRDEKKAYTILLYDDQDAVQLRESIQTAHPSIDQLKQVYQHLANYYQVAVGSHQMTTYDFDLEDFAQGCGLPPRAAYQALKTLEGEGFIQLSEAFFQPSQVYIPTSPQVLYAFQVAQATFDPLIKALLRLYGGELFATLGNISEQKIAHFLKSTPEKIQQQLQSLHQQAIIQYHPQQEKPQLTFTTARYSAAALPLATKHLERRAAIAVKKAEAVIHYAAHQHRCRTQLLLAYFGEITDQRCGQCDVCLARKEENQSLSEEMYQKYRHQVLQCLQLGMCDLKQMVGSSELTTEEALLATIRQMLDQGELAYDDAGRLVRKST